MGHQSKELFIFEIALISWLKFVLYTIELLMTGLWSKLLQFIQVNHTFKHMVFI